MTWIGDSGFDDSGALNRNIDESLYDSELTLARSQLEESDLDALSSEFTENSIEHTPTNNCPEPETPPQKAESGFNEGFNQNQNNRNINYTSAPINSPVDPPQSPSSLDYKRLFNSNLTESQLRKNLKIFAKYRPSHIISQESSKKLQSSSKSIISDFTPMTQSNPTITPQLSPQKLRAMNFA